LKMKVFSLITILFVAIAASTSDIDSPGSLTIPSATNSDPTSIVSATSDESTGTTTTVGPTSKPKPDEFQLMPDHCLHGLSSNKLETSFGYDCFLDQDCLCSSKVGLQQTITNWGDVQSINLLELEQTITNPAILNCTLSSEIDTVYVVDGKLVRNISISKFIPSHNKDRLPKSYFACPSLCRVQKCNGDSAFRKFFADHFNENAKERCQLVRFALLPSAFQIEKAMVRVSKCEVAKSDYHPPQVEQNDMIVTLKATGKAFYRLCGQGHCSVGEIYSVGSFTVPKNMKPLKGNVLTLTVYDRMDEYSYPIHHKEDFSCDAIPCFFCKENFYNFECSWLVSTIFFSTLALSILGLILVLFYVTLGCCRLCGRYKRRFVKAYVAVSREEDFPTAPQMEDYQEDRVYAETTTALMNNGDNHILNQIRPRTRMPLLSVLTISLCFMTLVQSCDKVFLTRGSCTSEECKYSYDVVSISGKELCFNINKNSSTLTLNIDRTKLIAKTSTVYYTSQFTATTQSQNYCPWTSNCKIDDCARSIKDSDWDHLHSREMKDLGYSGCYFGMGTLAYGCFSPTESCIWWTSTLNRDGDFWAVQEILNWEPLVELRVSSDSDRTKRLAIYPDAPVSVKLDEHIMELTLFKMTQSLSNVGRYLVKNLRTGEIRLVDTISPKGSPINGLIGELQCNNTDMLTSKSCKVDPSSLTIYDRDNTAASQWKHIDIVSLTKSLPFTVGDFLLKNAGGELTSEMIAHDEIHMRIEINSPLKVITPNINCEVNGYSVSGCYDCSSGAILTVETNSAEGQLQLKSDISTLNQAISLTSTKTEIRFHSSGKWLRTEVHWSCGHSKGVMNLNQLLRYQDIYLDGTYMTQEVEELVDTDPWSVKNVLTDWKFNNISTYVKYAVIFLIFFATFMLISLIMSCVRTFGPVAVAAVA